MKKAFIFAFALVATLTAANTAFAKVPDRCGDYNTRTPDCDELERREAVLLSRTDYEAFRAIVAEMPISKRIPLFTWNVLTTAGGCSWGAIMTTVTGVSTFVPLAHWFAGSLSELRSESTADQNVAFDKEAHTIGGQWGVLAIVLDAIDMISDRSDAKLDKQDWQSIRSAYEPLRYSLSNHFGQGRVCRAAAVRMGIILDTPLPRSAASKERPASMREIGR